MVGARAKHQIHPLRLRGTGDAGGAGHRNRAGRVPQLQSQPTKRIEQRKNENFIIYDL